VARSVFLFFAIPKAGNEPGKRAELLENDAQANGSPVRCCGVDLRSDDWCWSI